MTFDLDRFLDAQAGGVFERALAELRAGRKQSHWMWFVFPQLRGLGRSEASRFYGIDGVAEAAAYLAHPVLGPRLRSAFEVVRTASGDAVDILGTIDAVKLRSSATLFGRAAPGDPLYPAVLDRFFGAAEDPETVGLLDAAGHQPRRHAQ